MAKDKEPKPSEMPPPPPAGPQSGPPPIQLDESNVTATYANFCRVTGTPEEVLLDLGLNPEPHGYPRNPVQINQRIVTNYYTAKRLLNALALTIRRHEEAFGVLETDVQRRLQAAQPRPAQE
ncbi:MAG TPA: DUF3467 domain-containing protein [Pirellulales bacterium]|jgi:hypothetical protein|nr:DUF3467 domain-containing protein [Pirellulales bacterium]